MSCFYQLWKKYPEAEIPGEVLSDATLWGTDLSELPGFVFAVQYYMKSINDTSILEALKAYELNRHKSQPNEV